MPVGEKWKNARSGSDCTTFPDSTSNFCRNKYVSKSVIMKCEEKQKCVLVALHSCILVQLCKGFYCN